ncbi:MAG TPA: PAS domain S-box protein [Pyrinomonadaceae bacterium]|nr:PAS domain S-box protein [Pyrinomonadaceae bacterium]
MSDLPLQSDLLLTQLLDAGIEGILAFDRDCRYTAWNRGMERITGLSRSAVLGKSAFDVFPFLKETGEDKCFYAALAGEHATSENRPYIVPETSREGFFKGYYSPLFNQQHEIVGGIAVVHDITERLRAEAAAQEAHQRLTFHVENSPLAVIEWDSEFRVSRWSESAERLFGWRADEVIGKHVSDWHFVFDEDVDAVAQLTDRQRVGAELLGVQHNRNYTKDGSILYCEWYNSVLHAENDQLVSVLSLVLDVTARKLAEEERAALLARERDLRQQAEEADRLKDEFLATLSHELRTPLTSILGWATLVRNREVDKEENLDRALEIIERNARSQARLIDDLLDVSRIITGNLQLEVHPLNVAPIVEAAIEALRPAADAKGIQIKPELEPERCLVSGDPNRLRQVVWNLLMNAIKFTARDGSVSLNLKCVETGARLIVSDTGDGISAEFLPYVFHRFRQEEGSISRKAGGLGLGLAVVRHLVELHGGSVSAESAGPGQGSTFTVELPLAADRRDPTTVGRITQVDGDGTRSSAEKDHEILIGRRTGDSTQVGEEISTNSGGLFETEKEGPANRAKLTGVRVLLVEDDDDSRNLLSLVLERYGAEVVSVASSSEALDSFVREPPDIVISDIGMAEEDGYELIRRIRSLPLQGSLLSPPSIRPGSLLITHPSSLSWPIPAIALTGYATTKDRERALSAGYQLHLAKPVEPDDLIAAILSLIKQ